MARLIDADEAKKTYTAGTFDTADDFERVNDILDYAPTIDRPTRSQFKRMAVQMGYEAVIHCRECKEHRLFNGRDMCAKNATILDGHEVGLRATRADFYCAYGERRADFVDDNKIGERRTDEQ